MNQKQEVGKRIKNTMTKDLIQNQLTWNMFIGSCKDKSLWCRILYNWFWALTYNVHFNKEINDKNTLIRRFLMQSEHAYVIREHNFRKLHGESECTK